MFGKYYIIIYHFKVYIILYHTHDKVLSVKIEFICIVKPHHRYELIKILLWRKNCTILSEALNNLY